MNKILETSSYNYPRNLNLDLRPEIHNSYITRKNAAYSTIFINGLPYPSSNPRKFLSPVYSVFNILDKNIELNTDYNIHTEIISSLIQENQFLESFIREQIENTEKKNRENIDGI